MLFLVDIGNTNIVLGLCQGEKLMAHWRVSSDRAKLPDEYAVLLRALFAGAGLELGAVKGVALSSVVPPLTTTFVELARRYLGQEPLVAGAPGVRPGVEVATDFPAEVGADRLVTALAAFRRYGGPVIVIDMGTGTTFDAVSASGTYLGGAIAPGLGIAAEALFARTAKLPRVELIPPPTAIGRNTVHAMQSGLIYGYVGLIEKLVARIRRELAPANPEAVRVVATGGLADLLAGETDIIEVSDVWLTLDGLRLLWELNRNE